jgi:hypothetical protein
MNLWADKYEAIHSAEYLANNSTDPILKAHAQYACKIGHGYMKFAYFETDGKYKGASLWVYSNSSITIRPQDASTILE